MPPGWLLGAIAAVSEGISSLTGKEPMITRALVRELTSAKGLVFDCTKAQKELGLEPREPREIVRETARWCAFVGQVDESIKQKLPPDPSWKN